MAKRKAKRRAPVNREERVGPTPETLAKLVPDPFAVLVEKGLLDTAQRDAGLEIRAIWYAITGGLLPQAGERASRRSGDGMSDKLAEAHAFIYLPWARYWGRLIEDVIDLVVDARLELQSGPNIASMLADYAKRRRMFGRMGKAA